MQAKLQAFIKREFGDKELEAKKKAEFEAKKKAAEELEKKNAKIHKEETEKL